LIWSTFGGQVPTGKCNQVEVARLRSSSNEPTVTRARCLIAALAGIDLPSDAVRIKDVSPLNLPFSSRPSASAEALIDVDFRFSNSNGSWRITDLRTGSRDWTAVEALVASANSEKVRRAKTDMETVSAALERFRSERGLYVVGDSQKVLI